MRPTVIKRIWSGINTKRREERGIALISVILLIMVLSFVSAATIVTSITELKIGGNFKTSLQSFYNAEAGVQYALGQIGNLNSTGDLSLTGSPAVVHYGVPTSVYPLLSNNQFPFSNWTTVRLSLKTGTTTDYTFITTGYYATNSKTALQVLLRMPSYHLVKGMFSSGALDIKNNLVNAGSPAPEYGSNTSLSAGNTDFSKVVLGGGATYSGSAPKQSFPTMDPDPSPGVAQIVFNHANYSVLNNNANAVPAIVGNSINGNRTLPPGNYYLTSLTNGNLIINNSPLYNSSSAVNIYVRNTLSLTNITITAGSGPVTIYFHGSGTVNLNGATLNSGGVAGNLSIICDTGLTAPISTAATTFSFDIGASFSGLIYAPYADIDFKNNDNVRGLLWGKTITVKNNMTFQYDASAASSLASFIGSATNPKQISWKQL